MPSLNSRRFAGRPTCHGHNGSLHQAQPCQPSAEELRRAQVRRAAMILAGVEILDESLAAEAGPRIAYDDIGRKRDFKFEVRAKKRLVKPS